LDFAHLHAFNHGQLKDKQSFNVVLNIVRDKLGDDVLKYLHIHLYPVEWGARGEIRHHAFQDRVSGGEQLPFLPLGRHVEDVYFPRYEPFLELVVEKGICPTIICEAKDSQDIGALAMKSYYFSLFKSAEGDSGEVNGG
jgi:deoxyribonuclease-4